MQVFLDDTRPCPKGWTLARTAEAAIEMLETGRVKVISLDHDLGMKPKALDSDKVAMTEANLARTGYDVACWIEEQMIYRGFKAPEIRCHSGNPVGLSRIKQVIQSIDRLR